MTALNLRVLDSSLEVERLNFADELFHRINRLVPENQVLLTVAPDRLARDAVALMEKHGYSQLPVVDENGLVHGVFSMSTFATKAARGTLQEWKSDQCAPGDLPVGEFLEHFDFARVKSEMNRVISAVEHDGGVLVGEPENLLGIVTPMDFVRYLYNVASPFVMVSEIELALRALVREALNDEELAVAARRSLSKPCGGEQNVPAGLEEMTFDQLRTMICNGDNWSSAFAAVFLGTRNRMNGKLIKIRDIRNDMFHFKRSITVEDHQELADVRNWLLTKVEEAEGRMEADS